MRQYLVGGFIRYPGETFPLKGVAVLEDDEVMDAQTLAKVEAILLGESNLSGGGATRVAITTFQPFETKVPAAAPPEEPIHLNECSVILPPVDSPLLIEIAPGVLLRATRDEHAQRRNDLLRFKLQDGGFFVGRPRWTHA